MKLLAASDIHLGRRPSRLPEELQGRASALGPAGALKRFVDQALREGVDAVLLAGDLIEGENDFFEAYRELHDAVSRLTESGVPVIGVAGNHDFKVLPRLASELSGFRLLGSKGAWEPVTLERGGEKVTVWGWSFPHARVSRSPLEGADIERREGLSIGLLHCDRGATAGTYAPVSTRELFAAPIDLWLLGHVHQPEELGVEAPSGYLGSLVGLDPGEPGPRGAWLIEVERGALRSMEHRALGPMRWERLSVDLSGLTEPIESRQQLLYAMRELDEALSTSEWVPDAVGLRVNLRGRSSLGEASMSILSQDVRTILYRGKGGTEYFIENLFTSTQPRIPLEVLARRKDPAGLLARKILLLDEPEHSSDRQRLVAEARSRLGGIAADKRFLALDVKEPDDETAVERLREIGMRLLSHMLDAEEGAA